MPYFGGVAPHKEAMEGRPEDLTATTDCIDLLVVPEEPACFGQFVNDLIGRVAALFCRAVLLPNLGFGRTQRVDHFKETRPAVYAVLKAVYPDGHRGGQVCVR